MLSHKGLCLVLPFSLNYVSPVVSLIQSFGINAHCYAKDTQLYVSFTPGVDEVEVRIG